MKLTALLSVTFLAIPTLFAGPSYTGTDTIQPRQSKSNLWTSRSAPQPVKPTTTPAAFDLELSPVIAYNSRTDAVGYGAQLASHYFTDASTAYESRIGFALSATVLQSSKKDSGIRTDMTEVPLLVGFTIESRLLNNFTGFLTPGAGVSIQHQEVDNRTRTDVFVTAGAEAGINYQLTPSTSVTAALGARYLASFDKSDQCALTARIGIRYAF